jgi:CRISPR/Cas system CSM-associated protein Csm3 (group 7 of RAMP superfamily)
MGRGITHRVVFKGILTFDTASHIGSGKASAETDALLLRDGDDKIFIPGTSIGGVLRSRLEQLIGVAVGHQENIEDCKCLICRLFGTAESGASKIVVEDAYPTANIEFATAEYRDGVAIGRDTQTAREGAKYDQEIIPAGSTFDFELSLDLNDEGSEEEMMKIIYVGLEELCSGRINIGGSTTLGLGRCRLDADKVDVYALDFRDIRCLIPFLKGDDLNDLQEEYVTGYKDYFKELKDSVSFMNKPESHHRLELDFEIILEEGDLLVVKDGRYAFGDDPEIRFVRTKRWRADKNGWVDVQFIPGGSFKGALRNRAEQIIRTLVQDSKSACDPTKGKGGGCGKCAICEIFGFSKEEGEKGHKGRLSVEDAYPIREEEIQEKKFDFVAIDRFTGGALEKAKFDARIATDGSFKSRVVVENPKLYELALIAHLFKDLYLKDIRLGYGKYKGFGKVKGILREIRLFQTRDDDGLIADLNLTRMFPKTNGYWKRRGIWHTLTIPAEDFRNERDYKPLPKSSNLWTIIDKLDTAFNEFIKDELVRIGGGED